MAIKLQLLVFLLFFFILGCTNVIEGDTMENNFEKVSFKTNDGFTIHGDFNRQGEKAVILLHQFQLNRNSYAAFARRLSEKGFTVLSIDLRGHGESKEQNGLKRNFEDFEESDFIAMGSDVDAAHTFLKLEGFELYALVGSSIGANTALNYAASHPDVEKIVLLSPGLNYKGISSEGNASRVKANVLIVASEEDSYSFSSSKFLNEKIHNSEFIGLKEAGHGTNMLRGTDLERRVIDWIQK